MMKVEHEVSGGFSTPAGTDTLCTLHSHPVTARKQGVAAVDALRDALCGALVGQPFTPAMT